MAGVNSQLGHIGKSPQENQRKRKQHKKTIGPAYEHNRKAKALESHRKAQENPQEKKENHRKAWETIGKHGKAIGKHRKTIETQRTNVYLCSRI